MSDRALRDLERRALESGAVEDEAAWLSARQRAGTLDRERLALSAYCGNEAARHVLGGHAPSAPSDWVRGLEPFGVDAVRAFGVFFEAAAEPLLALGPDAGPWEDPLQAAAYTASEVAWQARRAADAAALELEQLRLAAASPRRLAQAEQRTRDASRAAEAAEAAARQARQAARRAGTLRELAGPEAARGSGVAPPIPSRGRRFRDAAAKLRGSPRGPFTATLAALNMTDTARDLLVDEPGAFERVMAEARRNLATWALTTKSDEC